MKPMTTDQDYTPFYHAVKSVLEHFPADAVSPEVEPSIGFLIKWLDKADKRVVKKVAKRDGIDIGKKPIEPKVLEYPSPAEIAAASNNGAGWTKDQLALWGVSYPPPKGWRKELEDKYEARERLKERICELKK